jgi:hypothetical protein
VIHVAIDLVSICILCVWIMGSNINENQSVIMKTDKIVLVGFFWFIENRSVMIKKYIKLRNLKKLEKSVGLSFVIHNLNFK